MQTSHKGSMFVYITWKNSKGTDLKTMVHYSKVQGILNSFVERGVQPQVEIPQEEAKLVLIN